MWESLESILFLINEAEQRALYVTEYDIEHREDRGHCGRETFEMNAGGPVRFDNYVAMEHGPVPGATRDMDYSRLLESADDELIENLVYSSKHT